MPLHKVKRQHNHKRHKCERVFSLCVLLERLGQVEALLHVVVVGTLSVDVSDAAVASFYSTVLLQRLTEGQEERKTSVTGNINQALYVLKISLNLRADVC